MPSLPISGLASLRKAFVGQDGTLTVDGRLVVNRCTWAHILAGTARVIERPREDLLSSEELSLSDGRAAPEGAF